MAFPTSGLTNNQVHKEGNRAFVYDSALGVWDQVRETDRTENKIFSGEIGGGTIGSGVTFPAGHVVQIRNMVTGVAENSSSTSYQDFMEDTITFTAGNHILSWASYEFHLTGGGADCGGFAQLYDSTGAVSLCVVNPYMNVSGASLSETRTVMTLLDKRAFSGISVTIKLRYSAANGAAAYVYAGSKLILMEIQA